MRERERETEREGERHRELEMYARTHTQRVPRNKARVFPIGPENSSTVKCMGLQ